MMRIIPVHPRARARSRIAGAIVLILALITTASCGGDGGRLVGKWTADTGKGAASDDVRRFSLLPDLTFGSDGTCTAESLRGDDARSAKVESDERAWKLVEDRGDRYVLKFTSPKSKREWLVTCVFADDDHIELVEREGAPGLKYARAR